MQMDIIQIVTFLLTEMMFTLNITVQVISIMFFLLLLFLNRNLLCVRVKNIIYTYTILELSL